MTDEKICKNCIHYDVWGICELDGSYRIEEFVEAEKLYCNFNPREPMIYIARW